MLKVLVLLPQGCEEIEAVTTIDILRRAGVEVVSAGLDEHPVRASRGVMLLPDTTLQAVLDADFDMLVLPGGQPGTNNLKADGRVLQLVQRMNAQGRQLAAICAAPSVFAAAGILHGKRATCFPTCLDAYPDVLLQNAALVEDGNLITSRGPGTAMDFALQLVQRLLGQGKREEVESALQR